MGSARKHVAEGQFRRVKRMLVGALIVLFGLASAGLAQQVSQPILPDGNTKTSLTTTGNVTNITTSTTSGNNAYNSFSVFNVNQNKVVNLFLPNNTSNLLNLVNSQAVNIDGLLNAIENGKIGGNVFFADPFGIFVSKTGVVNVGLFSALTPTEDFMNQFFTLPGVPSSGATAAMLNGTVPISPDGLISIQGTVNAVGNVGLYGGTVSNSGVIQSGAVFSGSNPDFSDVVNTNGIQNGASIAVQNGNIVIVAAGNIENAGAIATNGGSNLNAGRIKVQAGGNVTLDSGSLISASGSGQNSNGGKITISAQGGDGELASGARVTAIGGSGSGDGGTIDLSAKGALNDDGGLLEAGAPVGTAGTATLNGGKLFINANDVPNDGTNLAFTANRSITVLPYVVISSRQIGRGTNALTSPSTGDSGSISFDAPTITVGNITDILANATGTYTPGDITMTAKQSVADAPDNPLPSISANAQINIGNATISGGNVIITANAEADANKTPSKMANQALNDSSLGNLIGSYGAVSYKAASATSNIAIGDTGSPGGANITGSGDVTITSTAGATSVSTVTGVSGFAYGHTDSSATTAVASNAAVSSSGALAIKSVSNNSLTVKESTASSSPGIVAVAYGNAISSSKAQIDGTVSGDSVKIGATNTNNFDTEATDTPFSTTQNAPKYGTGISIALGFYKSTAKTNVTGSVTSSSGDATISSKSTDLQDEVFSSSSLSTDSGVNATAAKYQSMVTNMGGLLSQGSFWPSKAAGEGQTGQLGLAAAVSYVKGNNAATTTVTGTVSAGDNANIKSDAQDAPQITAAGSVSGQSTGVGGGVAVAEFSNTADTSVNGGAQVNSVLGSTSVTSSATMTNPTVDEADLIAADQNFSGGLSGITSVAGDAVLGLGLIGNPGQFATSFVNAGISTQANQAGIQGNNVGLAGSVAVLSLTNKSNASVTGAGTSVLAGYDSGGNLSANAGGNVNIKATSSVTSFNAAGMGFSAGKVATLNPGVGSGSSLGGSANAVTVTNKSTAEVGDGTKVKAASKGSNTGNVNVTSNTDTFELALVQSGDKAEKFGITGTLNYMDLTDGSTASIATGATVVATNDVKVSATNTLHDFALGGALGLGGSNQFDVGVNWNDIHQTTLAYIGDPSNSRTSICTGCGVNAGGNVNVDANSTEHLYAVTFAAASSGNPPPSPTDSSAFPSQAAPSEQNGAGGGGYSFGVSGEIAINQAGSSATDPGITTKAFINNGSSVTATGDVNVKATDSSQFVNAALAGSITGGFGEAGSAALAGAYDQNTTSKDVEAFTENSVITGDGLNVKATGGDNLFAVTIGGAVNTLGNGISIAGAVNNNSTHNIIRANVGDGTLATGIGSDGVTVNAQEGSDTVASTAGGFAGGSTGGVGAAVDIGNYNNTVKASTSGDVGTDGNVEVTANTDVQYTPAAVSIAAGEGWGAAGSVAVENINDATKSSGGGTVNAGENLLVGSKDSSSAAMIAGGVAIGETTLGVGVSALVPDFTRDTTASIADYANVSAAGSDAAAISYDNQNDVGILLDASTTGDLKDVVVGGAGSQAFALGGSLIIKKLGSKSLNDTTSATIGNHATVNGQNSGAAADQSVSLLASDNSNILDIAGMVAVGGKAGIGVGYDQITPNWDVSTSIGSGSIVNAAGNVILDSSLQNSINSYAIVGAASAGQISASVTGATSVINETSNVDSTVNGSVSAGGSVEVAALRNTSSLNAVDGNAAFALSLGVGVGVSLADITTNDTVDASIGGTGDVTALGNNSLELPDGTLDSSGNLGTSPFQGVSVTAMSFTSINPITAGVAGGNAGGQGSVVKDSYTETTNAHVDPGSKVNQTGDTNPNNSQSVQVLATDKTKVNSIAGGLSLGSLALTASVDKETVHRTVEAYLSGAHVNAADNVLVEGSMLGSITSKAVAGSVGGFAGDGAVSHIDETTHTDAFVKGASVVTANGNVEILANRNTSLTTGDGSVAAGVVLGANASHSIVNKNDTVAAYLDGGSTKVTALGQGQYSGLSVPVDSSGSLSTGTVKGLTVAATAKEIVNTNAIGASITGGIGGTGSKTTNNITESTSAKVKGGATVNGDNSAAGSGQGVNVLASDTTKLTNKDGAYSANLQSVGVGIGVGEDIANIQKTTTAGIGNNSAVNATGEVNVDALSSDTFKSHVAAVGGALSAGGAGTSADYSTNPITTTTTAYVGSCTNLTDCTGGATVNANSLGVDANDAMDVYVATGVLSTGGVASGAGELDSTVSGNTSAYIGALSDITAESGGVNVNSTFADTLTGTARAGSGSALASGEAAHASITDNSNNTAYIAGKAKVTINGDKGDVNVAAGTTRTLSATAKGLSVSVGIGAGGATAHATTSGWTKAYLANQVKIQSHNINIQAYDDSNVTSFTKALAGGIGSGTNNDSNAHMGDSVSSYIGKQGNITATGDINVKGTSLYQVNSTSSGNQYGGVTGGEDDAEATANPAIYAHIADNETINVPNGNIIVSAYDGYDSFDPQSGRGGDVTASATTTNGSTFAGGVGSKATATAQPTVSAYIGDANNTSPSTISAGNDLTIKTISDPTAVSTADATVYAAGLNASVKATSKVNDNNNTASTGPYVTLNAKNVTISASSDPSGQSTVKGGYGAAYYAGAGDIAKTNLTDNPVANVGSNDKITATGTVLVQSLANDLGYATSHNDIDSLVGSPVTTANIDDTTTSTTTIGDGAQVTGGTVNLNAKVNGLDLQTNSIAKASAADATAKANTTINATATPTVNVDGSATITGNNINMTASLANVDSDTTAVATTKGLTGDAKTNAYNYLLVNPTVNALSGSTFYTKNLAVNSVLPIGTSTDPTWDNSQTANNDTVTGQVVGVLVNTGDTVVNGITDAGNTIDSGFKTAGHFTKSLFDPPPSGLTTDNTINFNGAIGQSGGGSAILTIGSDGTVTQDTNVGTPTISNGQINVPDIVNNLQTNITFDVAGGTLNGNMTIHLPSNFKTVNITNNSPLDLVINGIQPYSNNNNQPIWNVTALTDNSTVHLVDNADPTTIDIENLSSSKLVFSGFIDNPLGSLAAFNQDGNIVATNGNIFLDNGTDLRAPSGSIGSQANPLNIQMSNDLSTSQGVVVPWLAATAGHDIYANVDAVKDVVQTPASTPSLTANLNSIQAGGTVDLNLLQGQVFVSQATTSTTGGSDFGYTTSSVVGNATYNLFTTLSEVGDTTVNVNDSRLNLKGKVTAGGAANIKDTGASIYGVGSGQVIQADGISLTASNGQIGTTSSPVKIDLTGGQASATANGDVNLNETAGPLKVGTITSSWGNVNLTVAAGDAKLGTVNSIHGTTNITASNSILNAFGSQQGLANINAENINLKATKGSIGKSGTMLTINSSDASPGVVNAFADQGIYLEEVSGDLNVDSIESKTGDIALTTDAGSILNFGSPGSNTPGVNLSGNNITLTSTNGSIGAKGNSLQIDSSGVVGGGAAWDVNLNETAGSLNVGTITSNAGDVNLTVPNGDANLGTVNSISGTTKIAAWGSILDGNAQAGVSDINANSINLRAGGTIGLNTNPLQIDSSVNAAGLVNASGGGDVNLDETAGLLNVGTITSSSGSVNLTVPHGDANLGTVYSTSGTTTIKVSGSILNALGANPGDANINAVNINLSAQNGSIGTSGEMLTINSSDASSGVVNGLADLGVYLDQLSGPLNVDSIESQTGDINILSGGSILNAGTPDSYTPGVNLTGNNITLTSKNGSIGADGNLLQIDSATNGPGVVNGLADLGVYLDEVSGDLNVNSIESQTGDINILSDGSILNAGTTGSNTPGVNLTGNNITLTSTNGTIGTSENSLVFDNRNPDTITSATPNGSNYLDMTAQGDIYINETGGNLLSHSVLSTDGNIGLLASNGNGKLDQVVGNQDILATVDGSLLDINNVTGSTATSQKMASPNNVSLNVLTGGGMLNVNHMDVYQSVTTRADYMTLADVLHTNLATPLLDTDVQASALYFDDAGATGGVANSININVAPCAGCSAMPAVIFDNYLTQTGTVNASVEWLEFINSIVGKSATFQNNWLNITLNNKYSTPSKAESPWYLFMIGNNFAAQNAFPIENEGYTFLQTGLQPTYAQPIGTIETDLLTSYGFLQ